MAHLIIPVKHATRVDVGGTLRTSSVKAARAMLIEEDRAVGDILGCCHMWLLQAARP